MFYMKKASFRVKTSPLLVKVPPSSRFSDLSFDRLDKFEPLLGNPPKKRVFDHTALDQNLFHVLNLR